MKSALESHDAVLMLRILYLRIEESADGFRWEVRLHDAPQPLVVDDTAYGSEGAARAAGQVALSKACGQFRAFKGFA